MSQNRKRTLCAVLALTMVLVLCAGCQNGGTGGDTPLLSLSFDEGRGNQVSDGAGQVQPAEKECKRPFLEDPLSLGGGNFDCGHLHRLLPC